MPSTTPTKKARTVTSTPAASKNDRNFVEVGALTDFQGVDTEPKLVNLPNAKKPNAVFIVRQGDKYEALSNICTHQGCEVDWSSADQLFECPCHGSQYDINGDNVGGPAPLPLASFAVKVENGHLLVSTKRNN
jgi:Rieske Fe-S protein